MSNEEKLSTAFGKTNIASDKAAEHINFANDNSEEPTVIHLGINDSDRVKDDFDDDDKSYKKSTLRKRPKDDTLLKFSIISCVLGILSCTIFLGNVPLAVIGLLFGLTAAANKYKTAYTRIGLICCAIGCVLSLMMAVTFVLLVIMLIIALLGLTAFSVLALVAIVVGLFVV